MAFSYGFFDSKNLDRVYTAEDFTSYLSGMICDGVFDTYGDNFSVSAGDNVSVVIGTGKSWIDGHFFLNDIAYKLDLKKYVDESLNRYVIIGISCDTSDSVRACQIEVKSGTAATSPSVPSFQNTDIRDAVCIAFCVNELLSILENTSLMGIPYPPALRNAIDVLQEKAGRMQEEKKEDDDNGNSET